MPSPRPRGARVPRTAATCRRHGRFEVETRGLGFAEAEMLLGAPAALRESVPVLGLETIARLAERFRAQSVGLEARRPPSSGRPRPLTRAGSPEKAGGPRLGQSKILRWSR